MINLEYILESENMIVISSDGETCYLFDISTKKYYVIFIYISHISLYLIIDGNIRFETDFPTGGEYKGNMHFIKAIEKKTRLLNIHLDYNVAVLYKEVNRIIEQEIFNNL